MLRVTGPTAIGKTTLLGVLRERGVVSSVDHDNHTGTSAHTRTIQIVWCYGLENVDVLPNGTIRVSRRVGADADWDMIANHVTRQLLEA